MTKQISQRMVWFLILAFSCQLAAAAEAGANRTAASREDEKSPLARWIAIDTAKISARYRYLETSEGVTTSDQAQHKELFRGRFLFDSGRRLTLNAGASSGSGFTGSWNNTGWGTGGAKTNIYLRELFLSLRPIEGVRLEYGGFTFDRGMSTEITTYDNDGYLTGQRIAVQRPGELFFDEISLTYGYVGDLKTPDLRKRFHRLQQSNYHQFLVGKRIGSRVQISFDYTFQAGIETLRQAAGIQTPELRFIDSILFENYQRVDVAPAFGFAVQASKTLSKRLKMGAGFADIDRNYGGLNADRFNWGNRVFVTTGLKIIPELSADLFLQKSVANDTPIANGLRLDLVVTYNVIPTLKKTGLF